MTEREPPGDAVRAASPVLLALRLLGFATVAQVAARPDVLTDEVPTAAILRHARDSNWVTERGGRNAGWLLSASGRSVGEEALAAELDQVGVRSEVVEHYRHFIELNPRALELCTRWQLRTVGGESRPNDHLDLDHDAAVVDDLAGFVADAVPTLHRLGSALDRFGHYPQRLGDAAEHVRNGNTDFVTRPMIDSFHTVWFELHENLLATLGRTRSDELGPNSLVDRPAR